MTAYRFPVPTLLGATFPNPGFAGNGLRANLERAFDEAFPTPPASAFPAVDVLESDTGITIDIDLPGVSPAAVEVLADDGVLTIRGERTPREPAPGDREVFSERSAGAFTRRFRLPKSADMSAISASYAKGVLTVNIHKILPAQPRRVSIAVDGDARAKSPGEG